MNTSIEESMNSIDSTADDMDEENSIEEKEEPKEEFGFDGNNFSPDDAPDADKAAKEFNKLAPSVSQTTAPPLTSSFDPAQTLFSSSINPPLGSPNASIDSTPLFLTDTSRLALTPDSALFSNLEQAKEEARRNQEDLVPSVGHPEDEETNRTVDDVLTDSNMIADGSSEDEEAKTDVVLADINTNGRTIIADQSVDTVTTPPFDTGLLPAAAREKEQEENCQLEEEAKEKEEEENRREQKEEANRVLQQHGAQKEEERRNCRQQIGDG